MTGTRTPALPLLAALSLACGGEAPPLSSSFPSRGSAALDSCGPDSGCTVHTITLTAVDIAIGVVSGMENGILQEPWLACADTTFIPPDSCTRLEPRDPWSMWSQLAHPSDSTQPAADFHAFLTQMARSLAPDPRTPASPMRLSVLVDASRNLLSVQPLCPS